MRVTTLTGVRAIVGSSARGGDIVSPEFTYSFEEGEYVCTPGAKLFRAVCQWCAIPGGSMYRHVLSAEIEQNVSPFWPAMGLGLRVNGNAALGVEPRHLRYLGAMVEHESYSLVVDLANAKPWEEGVAKTVRVPQGKRYMRWYFDQLRDGPFPQKPPTFNFGQLFDPVNVPYVRATR